MKKFKMLAILLGSMLVFTACGAKTEAPATETTVETPAETTETEAPAEEATENPELTADFSGVRKGEVQGDKETIVAEVTFENGKPVSVKFDAIGEDGKSKHEAAAAGEYVMSEGGTPWNEQVDALAAFLAENEFDLTKVTLTNEEGNTDAVTGVSIKVPELLKAVEAALN